LFYKIEYVTIDKYESSLTAIYKGGNTMAKECYFTGRKAQRGGSRSFSNNKSKRTFGSNLQKVRVLVDGKPKRVWVSARALKSGKVQRV